MPKRWAHDDQAVGKQCPSRGETKKGAFRRSSEHTLLYIYYKTLYSQLYRRITNLENLPELALMTKMPAGKEDKSKCASPPWKLAEATFAPEAV